MRRPLYALALAGILALGACSSGEVVVIAEIEVPDADGVMQALTLEDLEVQLIPFDRDQVFDSLTGAATNPEPPIPPALLEAQDSIRAAQENWQGMNTRWGSLRDELQTLTTEMEQYSPAEPRYRELFSRFNDLEGEYNTVDRQVNGAFERFDSLQKASLEAANEVRIQIENWETEAYASVDEVFTAKIRESGAEILTDTTGVEGATDSFVGLKGGTYWVTAWYTLPFTELYWNVPVEVVPGEPTVVRLDRSNATERPKL